MSITSDIEGIIARVESEVSAARRLTQPPAYASE